MLQKEEKKNYLLPGAYKPIVLKNISVKIVKKSYYHLYYKEGESGAIINIKLNRKKKIALYSLSNKPFYLNYLDCVEGQAKLYSINT